MLDYTKGAKMKNYSQILPTNRLHFALGQYQFKYMGTYTYIYIGAVFTWPIGKYL